MSTATTLTERRAHAAEWCAKQALRAGRRGDEHGFAVYQNRMYDVLEESEYPVHTTMHMVRYLGRSKAMVLRVETPIINLALNAG